MAEAEVPFAGVIHAQARRDPQALALVHEGVQLTYGELARRCDAAAALLARDWGVQPGDRVAWLGLNDPAQIVLLFALARLGAVLLPMNFRLAPPEWDAQFAQCGPKLVVHDGAWAEAAQALVQRHSLAAHDAAEVMHAETRSFDEHRVRPDAPALLVFTSGTTGAPKAAVHTQANLLANMRIASQAQGLAHDDRVLTVLPLFHVGGLCIQTLPALASGAQVILHSRFAPDAVLDAIENRRPTLTLQVPATMKALVEHPRWAHADLSSLRAMWAGSSLIPTPLIDAIHARGVPVCNVYGSTETGPFSIALGPADAMRKVGSCGRPAPGVEIKLVDVRADETGEVWVRAANVIEHYWPNQSARDSEGWFHTGDLARRDADGSYSIVGRAKDLIISGGENIHPAEIESALALHDAVLECAAFGVADAEWGEVVAVAVVIQQNAHADIEDLRAHLEGRIARYKLPRRWLFVDALPKTALGKVQRGALLEMLQPSPQASSGGRGSLKS
jgi:fatty-acyl-CoA synthase